MVLLRGCKEYGRHLKENKISQAMRNVFRGLAVNRGVKERNYSMSPRDCMSPRN